MTQIKTLLVRQNSLREFLNKANKFKYSSPKNVEF